MTDEKTLFNQQVDTMLEELDQVETWLEEAAADDRLRTRVRQEFAAQLRDRRQELERLKQRVAGGAMEPPLAWSQLRDKRPALLYFFQETLAFLQGVLSRGAGLDNGLCPIADAMLDQVSDRCGIPWDRFTIVAEGEFFQDMAGIIRLRFPDASIWSLPVAAHEFGHFVAQEMMTRAGGKYRQPFQELLEAERDRLTSRDQGQLAALEQGGESGELVARLRSQLSARRVAHLNEYFADIFATYVLGPAYACTCLLLRFDPSVAEDAPTHPAAARRAYMILKTLDQMGQGAPLSPYGNVLSWLRDCWGALLKALGQPESLSADEQNDLNRDFVRMYALLQNHLLPEARYDGWPKARSLASQFDPARGDPPTAAPASGIEDVLNAAWYGRIARWDRAPQISQIALTWCRQLTPQYSD